MDQFLCPRHLVSSYRKFEWLCQALDIAALHRGICAPKDRAYPYYQWRIAEEAGWTNIVMFRPMRTNSSRVHLQLEFLESDNRKFKELKPSEQDRYVMRLRELRKHVCDQRATLGALGWTVFEKNNKKNYALARCELSLSQEFSVFSSAVRSLVKPVTDLIQSAPPNRPRSIGVTA